MMNGKDRERCAELLAIGDTLMEHLAFDPAVHNGGSVGKEICPVCVMIKGWREFTRLAAEATA